LPPPHTHVLSTRPFYTSSLHVLPRPFNTQMYNFTDKEKHEVTLRPEMTPTLARMVLQMQNAATGEFKQLLPFKWFSLPQCWRFETTQRGRKREHYQWNMDIVGVAGVNAELELLGAVCAFFRSLGIGPEIVGIKVCMRERESGREVGGRDRAGGRERRIFSAAKYAY